MAPLTLRARALQDILGCLWEVLGDALEKRTYDILLVSALIKLRDVDLVMPSFACDISPGEDALI